MCCRYIYSFLSEESKKFPSDILKQKQVVTGYPNPLATQFSFANTGILEIEIDRNKLWKPAMQLKMLLRSSSQ